MHGSYIPHRNRVEVRARSMLGVSCHFFSFFTSSFYLKGHFCCVHLWTAWAQCLAAHMAIASYAHLRLTQMSPAVHDGL